MYGIHNKWTEWMLHVKWFTDDYDWNPQPFSKVITPTFWFWLVFTMFALFLVTIGQQWMERFAIVRSVHDSLNKFKRYKLTVLRVGIGIGLSLQLFTGTYLAPKMVSNEWWVYAVLVVAILALFHRRLLPVSGAALAVLYIKAILSYGLFLSLDYAFYPGIIYVLFVSDRPWNRSALPVLYVWMGISLAWVAMEKLTIAKLACSLMHQYGIPTLGFTVEDFVLISAFIEMGLAWAFMVGLMNRFSALLLSSVFMLTTSVFGFTEIVGHTIVHTLLLIFIIMGREEPSLPTRIHRSMVLRCLFVTVNFGIMIFGLMAAYIWMGHI
ncbi:hypothetical protein [Paenibacillus aquistagni]|uniref:hypothetical protein n=1 Tax=Paenibacillus aquistagni TaxID=1852522 RepID=UPI00145AE0F9|nr:hypothetical protein [Paenibacillus aquistagni]NMM53083.1 hypothetical protein [Paenibacillus aquistagni]